MERKRQKRAGRGGRSGRAAATLRAELTVRVADGAVRDFRRVRVGGALTKPGSAQKKGWPGVREREKLAAMSRQGVDVRRLAAVLVALGHPVRIHILVKLLASEATHKLLAKATGLKPGPLYYHLRELRYARLIGPKIRDLYVLTSMGRRAVLAALAVGRLCK